MMAPPIRMLVWMSSPKVVAKVSPEAWNWLAM